MSGYIGTQPVPQATQTRDSFTATSGQTSFATGGYTPNFLDVYLNGVKLASADYTATNGSDVVLTTGAALNDILEVVAYTTFTPADIPAGTPSITDNGNATAMTIDSSERVMIGKTDTTFATAGNVFYGDGSSDHTRNGLLLQLNRTTTDGEHLRFLKDGSAVGSIGTVSDTTFIAGKHAGILANYYDATNSTFNPVSTAGVDRDGLDDLGYSSSRFRDAYLSGGVFLGGTGSANKLDDVETGTWTPSILNGWGVTSPTYNSRSGYYTKVGNKVYVVFHMILSGGSLNGNALTITSFPFSIANTGVAESTLNGFFYTASTQDATPMFVMASNGTTGSFVRRTASNRTNFTGTDAGNGFNLSFSGTYLTDQ